MGGIGFIIDTIKYTFISGKKLIQFSNGDLPGNSCKEIKEFKSEITKIARKAHAKIDIFVASQELNGRNITEVKDYLKTCIGIKATSRKRCECGLVSYIDNGDGSTFSERFFKELKLVLSNTK